MIPSCSVRNVCVIFIEAGPLSSVGLPLSTAREPSMLCAYVSVTKGSALSASPSHFRFQLSCASHTCRRMSSCTSSHMIDEKLVLTNPHSSKFQTESLVAKMASMLLRHAMERAVKLLHHDFFLTTQRPALVPASMAMNDALIPMPSNPLSEGIWLAAPKSKVTPSRKKIRNNDQSKRLKNIVHFQICSMCGAKKLRHRLCMSCYKKGRYFV